MLICSAIIIYEFVNFIKLKNIIQSNLKIYQKILNLFKLRKASDLRKQKLIFNYSKSLFVFSIKIIISLISIFIFILSLNLISDTFLNLLFSIFGMIEISIMFLIYNLLKKNNAKIQ